MKADSVVGIPEEVAEAIARVAIWKRTALRADARAELGPGASDADVEAHHLYLLAGVANYEDAVATELGGPLEPMAISEAHIDMARPLARATLAKLLVAGRGDLPEVS